MLLRAARAYLAGIIYPLQKTEEKSEVKPSKDLPKRWPNSGGREFDENGNAIWNPDLDWGLE